MPLPPLAEALDQVPGCNDNVRPDDLLQHRVLRSGESDDADVLRSITIDATELFDNVDAP
jgi:hypothetical protein